MSDSATPWTVAHQAPPPMGILQARTLQRAAVPSSRGSLQPGDLHLLHWQAGSTHTHTHTL